MKPAIRMWRNTRMVVMIGVVAAIYGAAQVGLAPVSIPLLQGAQFRMADLLTMLLGVLCGPAGAFGVGAGNAIGDFFTGGLGLGSIFGFLSSISVGFVGYTFWNRLSNPSGSRLRQVAWYLFTGIVAAAVPGVILGWGLQLLGIAPFRFISIVLLINFGIGNCAGYLLYSSLYRRLSAMGLTWTEIMDTDEIGEPASPILGALLVSIGGLGGVIAAFLVQGSMVFFIASGSFLLILLGAILL
jgi:energy-coupling factor transport system substrate-specific component